MRSFSRSSETRAKSSSSRNSTRRPNSESSHIRSVPVSTRSPWMPIFVTRWEPSVWPIAWKPSISIAMVVAEPMSPPTPVVLSPSKNRRSPASDARYTMMSISRSDFHTLKRSSIGIGCTNPPVSPRRSIVATSIVILVLKR